MILFDLFRRVVAHFCDHTEHTFLDREHRLCSATHHQFFVPKSIRFCLGVVSRKKVGACHVRVNESNPPFGQVLGSPTAGGFRWFKGGVVGLAGHLTYEKEGLF